MSNAAAIMASLVDVRNLGTEKCIKMTIHVPAEQAMQVLEAFGWPTAVNPVPVAIARLNQFAGEVPTRANPVPPASVSRPGEPAPDESSEVTVRRMPPEWPYIGTHSRPIEPPRQVQVETEPVGASNWIQSGDGDTIRAKSRRPFESLPLSSQAGMLCADPIFWAFVREEWDRPCESEGGAAHAMYHRYGILSRSEIQSQTLCGNYFIRDRDQFITWKLVAA